MGMNRMRTEQLAESAGQLRTSESILLSGVVYTARDAAHKRMMQLLDAGQPLPFAIRGAVIYYAGPTPTPPGLAVGSCGPTTSGRMDVYAPRLLDLGLAGMIGKGERDSAVVDAIVRNRAVYLCALGGAGALACRCIKSLEVIAFEDLGCESVKRLVIEDFPLVVAVDSRGEDIFKTGRMQYQRKSESSIHSNLGI